MATTKRDGKSAAKSSGPIPVRALRPGWYAATRWAVGQEFSIQSEQELGKWMERLDVAPEEPEKTEE